MPNITEYAYDIRALLAKRGIWVGRSKNHLADHHVAHILQARNVACVLDVGANVGQFGQGLRDAGYAGMIVSFEPTKKAFDQLALRANNDPNWKVLHRAVGDNSGTAEINVSESTSVSSFLPVAADYVARHNPARVEHVETVEVVRLDDITADMSYSSYFLKTDTQGFDLKVIEGAETTIRERGVVGLQIELSVKPIYHGMPDYLEAMNVVRNFGFRLTGMFPVPSDPIVEFDGVYVRDEQASGF
jgi:FkbM family methyltransferase